MWKTLTLLQRFLNIYSECIVAWDRSTALSRCAARTGGDRSHRAERSSRSQGNNNGRQPSILSASACCCRHWKVIDVAATAPEASTSSVPPLTCNPQCISRNLVASAAVPCKHCRCHSSSLFSWLILRLD